MPTIESRISALEVFAKGGPYVEPTDTPTPTPPPPTPTPPPPDDVIDVPPGKLPSFQAGKRYALHDGGEYTPTDLTVDKVFLFGHGATLKLNKGQQWKVTGSGNWIEGLRVLNGGLGKDNQNAAVLVRGNFNAFKACTVEGADYVGITLDGDDCHFDGTLKGCGMAGAGGKGDRMDIGPFLADGNNWRKQRDGATLMKATRTFRCRIHNGKCVNGHFADVWFDINNADWTVEDCELVGCQSASGQTFEGVGIKTEIGGRKGTVRRCRIYGQNGPAVVVNECREISITDNDLANGTGVDGAVLHVRNDRRPDENQKADHPGDWQVKDLTFTGNRLLDKDGKAANGTGIVTGSPSTDDSLDFAADNIVIEPNAFTVKVKAWK